MKELYDEALRSMEATLRRFEANVPEPKVVPHGKSFVFRYVERTIHQAMVQKLARVVSGLHAAHILNEHGFYQEQASLQRMLDEFGDDVIFLALAAIKNDVTALHEQYLSWFYEEEFDKDTALESTQKRGMVPRKKIRAYIDGAVGKEFPIYNKASRTIHKTHSGYVHGASPQIMDLYGGTPPRFNVAGMRGTPREEEHSDDLWNYFYRGICSFGFVAKAFGARELFERIRQFRDEFEKGSPH